MGKDFDGAIGKTSDSFLERERIMLVCFPFNKHLVLISMEMEVDQFNNLLDTLGLLMRN